MSDIGEAPQAVDRKEMLSQQFDAVEQAAATTQTAAISDKSQPAHAAPAGGDRPRDESGKFVPKTVDKAQPVTAQPVVDVAAHVVAPQPQPWDVAPASWKKDKHALWTEMTPAQREYAFQREEQMRSGVEPLLPKAELADKITKAAEPYMNTVRGLGMDLPTAVSGLMKVDHDLRTLPYEQKLQVLTNVARSYGIDLTGQMQTAQPGFDPNMQQLQNELLSIKGQFSSFTQAQEAQQQRAAQEEIDRFAKTAEHFEDVKPAMAQLLQSGMAEGIQDAYEKAIRLDPEIFASIQTAKQAASDAEKRAAANAAAQRAKAAAVSVKSATPGVKTTTNAQDRRSMLREQLDGLSERL